MDLLITLALVVALFALLGSGIWIGLARHLAEWIGGLGLSQFGLLFGLMLFYIVLGCFLDGISMVVLTIAVIQPTIQTAASTRSGSASSWCWW